MLVNRERKKKETSRERERESTTLGIKDFSRKFTQYYGKLQKRF